MNTDRIRLLLIEDCPADARLIRLMLEQSWAVNIQCDWVDNRTEGIERLRTGGFDVVLLDLGLPESSGLDTLKVVCRETDVPTLVVMSGSSDEEVALQALQAGAQDYLIKGHVDGAALARSVRYAIGRTQAERALRARTDEQRQQAKYLRTLIDLLPMFVWLKDTHSTYLTVNQATAAVRGTTVEQMEGRSDADFWPREQAQAFQADDIEIMTSLQRKTVEETLGTVDGDVWVETYKVPVLDEDGSVLGTVGVARDIRERKAAEAAHKAAWNDKVAAYHVCRSMDRVVATYRSSPPGKSASAPEQTPPCADPGPYAAMQITPAASKPLEASEAHSPPGTATSPPSNKATSAEMTGPRK